jgi:uncharacterized protein
VAKGLGPFVVGTSELRREPGHVRAVSVAGELPGLALSESWIPDTAVVEGDLALEVLVDGNLTVSGTLRAPWEGTCRRCLREVGGDLEVEVSEVFEADPSDDADTYPLGADRVDLEPMVRDAVLLALPIAPLCGDDSRWAALGELKFD